MEGAEGLKHTIIHKANRIPLITIKSLHQIKVVDSEGPPDKCSRSVEDNHNALSRH